MAANSFSALKTGNPDESITALESRAGQTKYQETQSDFVRFEILPTRIGDTTPNTSWQEITGNRFFSNPQAQQILNDGFTLTDVASKNSKYSVYKQPASQALEPLPPLAEVSKLAPYDSSVKLNVQITNVPEISEALTGRDLLDYFSTASQVGAAFTRESTLRVVEHLAQPRALNNDLISLGKHYAQGSDQFNKDFQLFAGGATELAEKLSEQLDKPMTREQRAKMAGIALTFLILDGKVMDGETANQLGLEKMTVEQLEALGVQRFEMPALDVWRDDFSIQATIPGYPRSRFRAELPSPGVVEVTDIFSHGTPRGIGSQFLAQSLKDLQEMPTEQLIFMNITEQKTRAAFFAGLEPAESKLGRLGTKALKELGIEPVAYRWEFNRGTEHLSLVIVTH